jgi:hypothetical protein
MWAEGVGARALRGVRKAVSEDACEIACKHARGAEKRAAPDGDEVPSTLVLSRAMQSA